MAIDKSKLLKSAEKFIASGKVSPAIDEYLKILKENPKDWNMMIQIGDLYLKINKTADAIQYFQKVADHYNADGFFLKAIAIYKRINKLDPNFTEVCMKLADLYLKQGLTMDAKTQLQVVAQHYMSKNQMRDAIQTLKKLIEIEPDNLRSRNELAKAYKNEGMLAEAIQEYLEISDELTRKNLLKESLAVLETAFKLDPRNTSVLRKILRVYSEQNEVGKGMALLEDALKSDPTNAHVLALLAESYAGKKQYDRAHHTIDQAIVNTTDKEPFWTLKGDLYLKEGDLISAYEQYELVLERLVRRKDIEKAVHLLQNITKVDPSFHPALQRMVEFYGSLRQEANVVSTYNSLIDAYISKTMYPEAAECLEKLIALEPDNAQHQNKLEFVGSFLDKPPAKIKPEPQKTTAPEPPEPQPEEALPGDDFELDINLDLGQLPAPAAETNTVEDETATPVAQAVPTPVHTVPSPTRPAPPPPPPPPAPAPPAEATEEEKEFVSEHLIEAEVFTKYGLIDKAIEQLHMITSRYPNSVVVHQKLKEIYLEKGDRDRAVEECVVMSRIFRKQGDLDQAEDLLSEAQQINPNHPSLDRAYKEMPAAAVIAEPALEPEPLVPVAPAPKPPTAEPVVSRAAKPAPPPAPKPAPSGATPSPTSRKDLMGELEKIAMGVKSRPPAKTAPVHKAPPPPRPPQAPPPPKAATVPEEILTHEELPVEAGPGAPLNAERFEEIDFYTSQGLMSEAHRLLQELKDKYPDDPGVTSRLAQFEEVKPGVEELFVPEEQLPSVNEEPVSGNYVEADTEVASMTAEESLFVPESEMEPESGVTEDLSYSVPDVNAEEPSPVESVPDLTLLEEQAMEEAAAEPEEMHQPVAELYTEEEIISVPGETTEPSVAGERVPEPEELAMETLEAEIPEEPAAIEPDISSLADESAPEEVESLFSPPEMGPSELHEPAAEGTAGEQGVSEESIFGGEALDLTDFGELSVASEMEEPIAPAAAKEQNPFEGNVSEEPSSEATAAPVEFGEAVEIAEHVVEAPEQEGAAEPLEFPAERSLDDALDAAFQEDEEPEPEETKPVKASQELFEEEEDFFDLAAELEEGFLNVQSAVEEDRPADGQNYSIEEILTDFKKGVEKQLGAEDYDTRYNLGIAYKEMGLVDEAIAEFQIAAKDEKRFLECCSMLGLCFVEKGMPKLALKWYQRGLETKGHSEEEYLGLRFELGSAYEAMGEEDKALECYQDVYGANAGYRNVSKRIKDLQQQLKNK